MKNYIRYGVHKKKNLLRDASKAFDGLVIPANILLYQYRATPGAIVYLDKPYFIDPMSYLFGESYEDFKRHADEKSPAKFKPSFEKLLVGHNLSPDVFLGLDYTEIRKEFLGSPSRLSDFVQNCLKFQTEKVEEAIAEIEKINDGSIQVSSALVAQPQFLVPPYVYLDQRNLNESLSLTDKILAASVKYKEPDQLRPLIYLNKGLLKDSEKMKSVIDSFKSSSFSGYVLWINDFNECTDASEELIVAIAKLVHELTSQGQELTFLHAGYFGMLFRFFGATAISHGLGYGEVRSGLTTAKGGGPPPVRYYLKDLHMFLTLDKSLELLRAKPDLICDCPICRGVIGNNPENVVNFDGHDDLADLHYLYVRKTEKDFVNENTFEDVIGNLSIIAEIYDDVDGIKRQLTDKKGKIFHEQIVSSEYLTIWKNALTKAASELEILSTN